MTVRETHEPNEEPWVAELVFRVEIDEDMSNDDARDLLLNVLYEQTDRDLWGLIRVGRRENDQ